MTGPRGRMLELLSLLQNGATWPGAELAARLGISPRTLRRDLDTLRELGYPVLSERGPGGSYRLSAGKAMPPLLFTDEEAVATVIGLRTVAGVSAVDNAAEAALRKLEQVLPPRLRARMAAVSASTELVADAAASTDPLVLQQLGTAAHEHLDVGFGYRNRAGTYTERRVQPYRQVLLGRRWYLLGWDRDRADWRTFRLDRIRELTTAGSRFAPRALPEEGAVSFVQRSARFPLSRHQGVVRFAAPLEVVADRLYARAGSLEAIDEHSCRYVTAVDSWEWLAMSVAMVGVPYTVESPAELVEHSALLAARITAALDGD